MIFLQIYIPTLKYSLIQMACVVKVGNMSFINGNLIFLLVKLNHLSLVLDLKKKIKKWSHYNVLSEKDPSEQEWGICMKSSRVSKNVEYCS